MDKGIVEARRRACMECPHRRTAHASVWRWHHCTNLGMDVELSPDKFEEVGNRCSRWVGLKPVDVGAEQSAQEAQARDRSRTFVKPYLDAALKRIPSDADKASFLVELVAAGRLRRDVAEERALEEGLLTNNEVRSAK